ncbi:hypothetical protein GQ600_8606 [Phytophthora cactorum]|nr:hypothetical protein GQ600_8606 [Phytophthora cactorum]
MSEDGARMALAGLVSTRKRILATLQNLRRRLHVGYLRSEPLAACHADVGLVDGLEHRNNLINMTHFSRYARPGFYGFDHSLHRQSFTLLLESFSLFFTITKYSPRGGRPRKLQHRHQVLGLLLSIYVGSMQNNALCMIFGVPDGVVSPKTEKALHHTKLSAAVSGETWIAWLSLDRQKEYAALAAQRQPLLRFKWDFIDRNFSELAQSSICSCSNLILIGFATVHRISSPEMLTFRTPITPWSVYHGNTLLLGGWSHSLGQTHQTAQLE